MHSRTLAALALTLAGALSACSKSETHARSFYFKDENGVTEATAHIDGVAFEFAPSVQVHFGLDIGVAEISNDGDPSGEWTVAGHTYGIADGELFIGAERYGEVRPGDRVVVSADGVTVNGEHRGALP